MRGGIQEFAAAEAHGKDMVDLNLGAKTEVVESVVPGLEPVLHKPLWSEILVWLHQQVVQVEGQQDTNFIRVDSIKCHAKAEKLRQRTLYAWIKGQYVKSAWTGVQEREAQGETLKTASSIIPAKPLREARACARIRPMRKDVLHKKANVESPGACFDVRCFLGSIALELYKF